MTKLPLTQDMLLGLFPTPLEGLDVAVLDQTEEDLDFVYVQRNTDDPYNPWKHWEGYDAWVDSIKNHPSGKQKVVILRQPPKEYEQLYFQNAQRTATEKGIISPEDRLLMTVSLRAETPAVIHLGGIQRNRKSDDLKGIGSAFYSNLITTLKTHNVDYLTGVPTCNDTANYWEAQGQVPFHKLPWSDQQAFQHDLHRSILYIHKLK